MRLDWQRRAVVVFGASLLILSTVLVFSALREAKRERLLKEQEIASERRRTVADISARARSLIQETEKQVFELLKGELDIPDPTPQSAVSRESLAGIPLVSEAFIVDGEGLTVFLTSTPLFVLPGEKRSARNLTSAFEDEDRWARAEDAEFRLRDYSRAASLYREVAARTSDPALEALLLNRLGRCYAKWGRADRALAVYREQLQKAPPDLSFEGLPLGIIALTQVANIHRAGERNAEAAEVLLDLYQGLMDSRWPLSKSRFEYFLGRATNDLRSVMDGMSASENAETARKFEELGKIEEPRLVETAILEKVQERIVPLIKLEAGAERVGQGEFRHAAESTEAGLLLASYRPLGGNAVFGILFDPEVLAGELFPSDDAKAGSGGQWSVEIVDAAGAVLASNLRSGPGASARRAGTQPVFSAGFSDAFPPWTISLYQEGSDPVEREFRLRRNMYVLSLAGVVAALLFGGFLAIRSTARELRLARLKSDFVATVSHEFRTPLTSIRYMAEILQRGRVPEEERKQRYYETITAESERLSRLVENLLDFSKIEAGMKEYRMEETDLGAVAEETVSRFRQQAVLQEFRLESEIAEAMPLISADKEALSRAIFNLLDNAVKYSGGRPHVVLRVWSRNARIHIQVEDEGIGISPAEQKRIFDKFYRSSKALEQNIKGSGIGLPLVDHIIGAHGGKVSLESEPGRGTRVTIELPVTPAAEKKGNDHG